MPLEPLGPVGFNLSSSGVYFPGNIRAGKRGADWRGELPGGGLNIGGVDWRVEFDGGRGAGGRPSWLRNMGVWC